MHTSALHAKGATQQKAALGPPQSQALLRPPPGNQLSCIKLAGLLGTSLNIGLDLLGSSDCSPICCYASGIWPVEL